MPSAVLEKLNQASAQIDRPGTYCASGSVPAVLPGLEVEGLGPIGLPLTPKTAKDLIKHCHQAPYGKGEKTLVDTKVRRVWRMEPDHFTLRNPDWDRVLKEIVGKVQAELGLESQKLESHIYDLLLYEPGSFFLPHRDGEKIDRMVATLVVVLPSSFEGGELVVRHEGQERTIDFGGPSGDAFHIHYAAFYADCEHEVRPLTKGHRLCLVYNLTLAKSKKSLSAPRDSEHIAKIAPLIEEWASDESAEKLGIALDHQYTEGGLSWDALKGTDRAKARVLAEAARQAGCRAFLTLLTLHESGSAEYAGGRSGRGYGYGGRRSGYGDYGDDGDASDYEMGEIYETSLTANHWSDAEGNRLPIGELVIQEDDLLDPEAIRLGDPETEFEGYTGNAGMTLDHWYRHAAIFIWPARRHFAVICERDSRAVEPELGRMVARWKTTRGEEAAALEAQCRELAAAIVEKWPGNPYGPVNPEVEDHWTGGLLGSLAALDDTRLIADFLGGALIKDATAEPGKSVAALGQKFRLVDLPAAARRGHEGDHTRDDGEECPAAGVDLHGKAAKEGGLERAVRVPRIGTRGGHRIDRPGRVPDRLARSDDRPRGNPRRPGPLADRHRAVRADVAGHRSYPRLAGRVSADGRPHQGARGPPALARQERQAAVPRPDELARLGPQAARDEDSRGTEGTGRLSPRGTDQMRVHRLRHDQAVPGGPARAHASIQGREGVAAGTCIPRSTATGST